MLSKTLKSLTFLLLMIAPGVVTAVEVPPGKWWHAPQVSRRLDLRAYEKQKLDELFVESRRKLIDLKSRVEREQFELEAALEKVPLDEAGIMDQGKKLENARAALGVEQLHFLIQIRKILGPERFQQLKRLYREFRYKRRNQRR
jgi:Spy/CpxP family protein refolding chaperone